MCANAYAYNYKTRHFSGYSTIFVAQASDTETIYALLLSVTLPLFLPAGIYSMTRL